MQYITILGSTGSIGKTTLLSLDKLKDYYKVYALCAHSNVEELYLQILKYSPKKAVIFDEKKKKDLQKKVPNTKILSGLEGLIEVVTDQQVNFVMSAISGSIGLIPTIEAIKAKKTVGLANKEVMVNAGELVNKLLKENNTFLLPVDSEHSAIFQALRGNDTRDVKRLILTSSGGPFFKMPIDELEKITLNDALIHPNFKMGKKITIDSSTMMNKGLEVIEAYYLFNVDIDKIDVVIHPEQIVHSMVEYLDGSIIAQLSIPTMEIPIRYALSYPKRIEVEFEKFDFTKNSKLSFFEKDLEKFLCLKLAFEAIKIGKSMPCFMNVCNEVLVEKFLNKEISWLDISRKLEKLMSSHRSINVLDLDSILEIEKEAKIKTESI